MAVRCGRPPTGQLKSWLNEAHLASPQASPSHRTKQFLILIGCYIGLLGVLIPDGEPLLSLKVAPKPPPRTDWRGLQLWQGAQHLELKCILQKELNGSISQGLVSRYCILSPWSTWVRALHGLVGMSQSCPSLACCLAWFPCAQQHASQPAGGVCTAFVTTTPHRHEPGRSSISASVPEVACWLVKHFTGHAGQMSAVSGAHQHHGHTSSPACWVVLHF